LVRIPAQAVEEIDSRAKEVHQRLKPECNGSAYGTTEVVPLNGFGYFNKLLEPTT
jgi:hypothetical protein